MKKYAILFTLLFLVQLSIAQIFEGEIVYKISFKSKLPNVTDEQFAAMMGNEMKYQIKNGDYKNIFNGTFLQYQLYLNKDNKIYNKLSNSETLMWNDGSTAIDAVLKSEVNKNVTEVLGYACDEIVLTTKTGVQKYYFNKALGIDSKLYAKHNYGNWFDYVSKANAVPLKLYIENAQFVLEAVALEIRAITLDSKIFELPAGAVTAKSPY